MSLDSLLDRLFRHERLDRSILLTFKMFSVCKDFFMASMRPRLLVELSQG